MNWRRKQLALVSFALFGLVVLMLIELRKLMTEDYAFINDIPITTTTTAADIISSSSSNSTSESNNNIRRWGCHRTEAPFIFVHIGKAGGGEIRRKIAAAAVDYNRGDAWRKSQADDHYYPIADGNGRRIRHGKFCNSGYQNFYIPFKGGNTVPKSFEGSKPCNATTPLGNAIGCPAQYQFAGRWGPCSGCNSAHADDVNSTTCDLIYVGHNMIGNEMHWLPPKYLSHWWHHNWHSRYMKHSSFSDISVSSSSSDEHHFDRIYQGFNSILPNEMNPRWCKEYNLSRPNQIYSSNANPLYDDEDPMLMQCSKLASLEADLDIKEYWGLLGNKPNNYSPLYASLPLHRAVMIREPFSWLKSKFYWHKEYLNCACDDIKCAHRWVDPRARLYIYYLCGEDCRSRYDTNAITLDEMVDQAEDNLRNSFSVVGLLNETTSFYDMIEKRLSYMNMSQSLPSGLDLGGGTHSSGRNGEKVVEYYRCLDVFKNATFHQRLREELPSVAALERLYRLGVEVNRFQKEELRRCV